MQIFNAGDEHLYLLSLHTGYPETALTELNKLFREFCRLRFPVKMAWDVWLILIHQSIQIQMKKYYVNTQPQSNGDHEVHDESCYYLPGVHNRIYLGDFSFCTEAVQQAFTHFYQVNGCKFCSPVCHTG